MSRAPAPFVITLTQTQERELRAIIKNQSTEPQMVLHDSDLQPSILMLTVQGKEVPSFDSRSIKKFDNTVYRSSYTTLPPEGELELGRAQFKASGRTYQVRWGPYQFDQLAPGHYKARVGFKSDRDEWVDDDTEERGKHQLWKGMVLSNEVEVHLPAFP